MTRMHHMHTPHTHTQKAEWHERLKDHIECAPSPPGFFFPRPPNVATSAGSFLKTVPGSCGVSTTRKRGATKVGS